jgi:hypothetical protein
MTVDRSRRAADLGFGSLAVGAAVLARARAHAATDSIIPPGAHDFPN